VEPSDFGILTRDRSWNGLAQTFIAANRAQLNALGVEPELVAKRDRIDLLLRPGGVVGAIPLKAPNTQKVAGGVVVGPRFGWEGIGPLLHKLGWSAQPQILEMPLVPGSAHEVPPWVLAGPVLQRLGALLDELHRGFRLQEAVRQTPRGQILWGKYITSQVARGAFHCLPCRFPALGPDVALRSYLRWGIESVQRSLTPFSVTDVVARRLCDHAQELLFDLRDIPARSPDRHWLDLLRRDTALPSEVLSRGLEALGWIVDERGIAGRSETDGLAWSLPMHELFERWIEHIVRIWARDFGGEVRTAHRRATTVPIRWLRPGHGSLTSLIPDFVVRHQDCAYIVDAKYKDHFVELDESRWTACAAELREEHRHDLHQVLAYAALIDAREITSVLVYPMQTKTWQRLSVIGHTVRTATISSEGRQVRLALAGVPMRLADEPDITSVVNAFDRVRVS
jgi:hypothetical protein